MGVLRLILAIAVFAGHTGNSFHYYLTEGSVAVQCFFIISGFSISLVLNEKYMAGKNSFSGLYVFY